MGPTSKGREGREGKGLLIRGGGEGKGWEGKGRVPPVITVSPGSRGARIVTACKTIADYSSDLRF